MGKTSYPDIKSICHTVARLAAALICMAVPVKSAALPASHYSASSVLAEGRWARIRVTETGMQRISAATLRSLGFSDPSKVNVYGYGGRVISSVLDERQIDDLPLLPSVRTDDGGIIFFGTDHIGWKTSDGNLEYEHMPHPYSDASYYFISDREISDAGIRKSVATSAEATGKLATTFTARLVHDNDIAPAGNSGRLYLGEDFRTQRTRSFRFNLPGNTSQKATVLVNFASKTVNGAGSLMFSANGTRLPSSASDRIPGISNSEQFVNIGKTVKTVSNAGETLNFEIQYSPAGVVYAARLDYLEVEYTRALNLDGGQLHFYGNASEPTAYTIEGCPASTIIWDVTDPGNPLLVEHSTSGSKASFTQTSPGYREYVAFDPKSVKTSPAAAGRVSNQDIHSLPTPDMLIITPAEYMTDATRVAELRRETDGMRVHVLTPEMLYNEFSCGTPDVSAFRKALKMWHDRGSDPEGHAIRYCLIISRPTYDNKMLGEAAKREPYPRVPIWQSPTGLSLTTSYSTDDFIGMLDDSKDGTFSIGIEKITVAVGRWPVKSSAEMTAATDKLLKYVKEPNYGAWRNNVLLLADDQDNGVHLEQAQAVYNRLSDSAHGKAMTYERLYMDAYSVKQTGTGATYPDVRNRLFSKLDEGVLYMDYIGHASPRGWTHENVLTWTDITTMSNRNLPFIYSATCEFCRWDDDQSSGAEEMWLSPHSGAIGMITTNRTVYIAQNGQLNNAMSNYVFAGDTGNRVGDIYRQGKNAYPGSDENKLRYVLLADPAMKLPVPRHSITLEKIGDTDMTAPDFTAPELPARGKVSVAGSITETDGTVMTDFNGFIEVSLFDAEKPVTTLGNGEAGKVITYNDRKSRLFTGKAKVTDGKWELMLLMPLEIENNYSPARLSFYAYSDDGREAHGASESLYVYGYDNTAADDEDGPEITRFVLNSDSFTSGQTVSDTPVALVTLYDPSGINLSESGLGHNLKLTLDGKEHYTDIGNYFTPDPETPGAGTISYPMGKVDAGNHTLTLTAWDNANNSSSRTIDFKVSAIQNPAILSLTTDASPATTSAAFTVTTDRPLTDLDCRIDVFDLGGTRVWSSDNQERTGADSTLKVTWNLLDSTGHRVPRGIYIYRATVRTADGHEDSLSKKMAVAAPN